MRLNLKRILQMPGAAEPFVFSLDLSDMEFGGLYPISEQVEVSGQVRNRAGALEFSAQAVTNLHLTCDRCGKSFVRRAAAPLETLLGAELQNEEQDDIVPLADGCVDAGELMRTAFILHMDSKNLCSQDCKGLCPGCGADLNEVPCRCKPEVDPRLAALADFFK